MLFDTGSYNLFVLGEKCKSMSCENHMKYIIKGETKVLNENDKLNYVSGKSIGNLVRDDIKIGNLIIKKQIIHVG